MENLGGGLCYINMKNKTTFDEKAGPVKNFVGTITNIIYGM
jgi:hypothetical protein